MEFSTAYSREEEEKLPLLLMNVGIGHRQEPIERPNGTGLFLLLFTTVGSGEVFMENGRRIVHKDQGMFLMPDTPQVYHAVRAGWKVDFVTFSGTLCASILNSLGLTGSSAFSFPDPELIHRHVLNFRRIYLSDRKHKNLLLSEECFSLLVDVSFSMNRIDMEPLGESGDIVMRVIDFLEHNYMKDISLDDIAAYMGLSKEHLCRVFREKLHDTIIDELNKIRVTQAARMLLQNPDKTALEIGMECGFLSPSYFGKVFKKLQGMTPNMYRLKNGR